MPYVSLIKESVDYILALRRDVIDDRLSDNDREHLVDELMVEYYRLSKQIEAEMKFLDSIRHITHKF